MTNRAQSHRWRVLRERLKRRAVRSGTFRCIECRRPLDPSAPRCTENAAELDHMQPVALRPDLEFDESNLAWRCHPCNRRKGTGPDTIARMPTTRVW